MLLRQDRGRHQDRHLFALDDGHEGTPQGHFGFAVADIPADEAVHGRRACHIPQQIFDRFALIRRFLVGEPGLEGAETGIPGSKTMAVFDPCARRKA